LARRAVRRYFVNTSLWRQPDGPVFLYIQGEGSFDAGDVVVGQHMELAAKHGALVFGLEVRASPSRLTETDGDHAAPVLRRQVHARTRAQRRSD
jgi:hypothetical protein